MTEKKLIRKEQAMTKEKTIGTGRVKKSLSALLALLLIFTCVIVAIPDEADASMSFSDLPSSHWAYESVKKMQEKGIIKGYPDGTFGPAKTVTYGEFIKMTIVALDGKDDVADIENATHWASKYYKAALDKNLFSSGQIAEKSLNLTIPRYDMALIAANAVNAGNVNNYEELMESLPDVDTKTVNSYQILQSYAEGMITGYEDGTFRAFGTLSRAEASAVIYRLIDKSARKIPNIGGTTKEEPTVSETDATEWHTDEHGTFKYVNLSDFVDMDVLKSQIYTYDDGTEKSISDVYYLPDKAKYYKTELGAIWKEELSFSGRQRLEFDEFCMDIVGIKDRKVIAKNEGFEGSMPQNHHMRVTYDPAVLNAKTFDCIMALSVADDGYFTDKDLEEMTPRIYMNPFK